MPTPKKKAVFVIGAVPSKPVPKLKTNQRGKRQAKKNNKAQAEQGKINPGEVSNT